MKNIIRNRRALSSILATIIIFGLIMMGLAIGVVFLLPFAQQTQEENNYVAILSGLYEMDGVIKDLMQGSGQGATASITFAPAYGSIAREERSTSISFSDGVANSVWEYDLGYLECRFLRTYSDLTQNEEVNIYNPNKNRIDVSWWESTDVDRDSTQLDPTNIILRRGASRDHYITLSYGVEIQTTTWINPNIGGGSTWVEINIILTIIESTNYKNYFSEIPYFSLSLSNYSVSELYSYNDSWQASPSLSLSLSVNSIDIFDGISSNLVLIREIKRVFTIDW